MKTLNAVQLKQVSGGGCFGFDRVQDPIIVSPPVIFDPVPPVADDVLQGVFGKLKAMVRFGSPL